MMVLPLYWMMWHDRPTSLPPPRQRNMSSSAGSTGSSGTAEAMAAALRLDAMVMKCWGGRGDGGGVDDGSGVVAVKPGPDAAMSTCQCPTASVCTERAVSADLGR